MPPKSKEPKADVAPSTYELGDTVLGKIRGYPPWPGQVVDPDNVPKNVTKERPQGKKGKFYCVRFLPEGSYAWVVPKDMSRLQTHEINAYIAEPFRKSGELLKGYKAALDPSACWESLEAGVQEAEDAEVDQLESDGEEGAKPKAKKRKRESQAADKPAKEKKEPARKSATNMRKSSKASKSKETVESEDEAAEDKPANKKAKKDDADSSSETVKTWRHKLQKAFLNKDKSIRPEDMPEMDRVFTQIEKFDMSLDNLSYSKIGKVMRHIAKLEDNKIPADDEHHFRERSQKLVEQWGKLAGTSKHTNGESKEDDGEAEPGDLTMMADDAKADTTMDVDAKADADADGEADADADAEPAAADGDEKMDDA